MWDEGYTRQVVGVGGVIEDQYPKTARDVLRKVDVRIDVTVRGKRVPLRAWRVDRYLGSSPTFALGRPLVVRRGYIVALTVPTWAPAFAVGLPRSDWWRSSRRKNDCKNVSQMAAQQTLRSVKVYGCTYFTARVLYSATFVPDPQPTS
jgi:hypothetical protein